MGFGELWHTTLCPICGKDLIEIEFGRRWFFACDNSKCTCKGVASYVVWEHIDRTRRALDVAKEALKYARQRGLDNTATLFAVGSKADKALAEITTIEQKD